MAIQISKKKYITRERRKNGKILKNTLKDCLSSSVATHFRDTHLTEGNFLIMRYCAKVYVIKSGSVVIQTSNRAGLCWTFGLGVNFEPQRRNGGGDEGRCRRSEIPSILSC